MSEKLYLVTLSGQGDTDIKLVKEDVWNWINLPYSSNKSSYFETLEQSIVDQYKPQYRKTQVMVTRGSYDNDRALQAPGIEFASLKDVFSYLKENNLEIEDEYEGGIY